MYLLKIIRIGMIGFILRIQAEREMNAPLHPEGCLP